MGQIQNSVLFYLFHFVTLNFIFRLRYYLFTSKYCTNRVCTTASNQRLLFSPQLGLTSSPVGILCFWFAVDSDLVSTEAFGGNGCRSCPDTRHNANSLLSHSLSPNCHSNHQLRTGRQSRPRETHLM